MIEDETTVEDILKMELVSKAVIESLRKNKFQPWQAVYILEHALYLMIKHQRREDNGKTFEEYLDLMVSHIKVFKETDEDVEGIAH